LFNSPNNGGVGFNKFRAIKAASFISEFAVLFDSDNIISNDYINSIPNYLSRDTIYSPSFAKPNFDYRRYAGVTFDKNSIKQHLDEPEMGCLLNT